MTFNQRTPIIAGIVEVIAGAYVLDCGNYPATGAAMIVTGLFIAVAGPIAERM